jgi:general secretion pathway protein E
MFEMLQVGEELHELIINQASARDIRKVASEHGMRSLQECGWEQIKLGRTSLAEVMKFSDLSGGE